MIKQIVLLSGHVCAGKTTLAEKLHATYGFHHVKTWSFLQTRGREISLDRSTLQDFGENLDRRTGGRWVAEDLEKLAQSFTERTSVVLDAVRHPGQINALRDAYGR